MRIFLKLIVNERHSVWRIAVLGVLVLCVLPGPMAWSQVDCYSEFVRFAGDPGVDEGAACVIPSSLGGLLIGGYKEDDALVVKTDLSGNVEWSMSFPITPFADRVISLFETSDQYLIGVGAGLIAASDNRGFIFKIDQATQTLIWARRLDGASAFYDVHEVPGTGELILTGVNDVDANLYYVKVDASTGAVLSARTFIYVGQDDDYISTVITQDAIYAAGRQTEDPGTLGNMKGALTKMDLNGDILYNKIYLSPLGATSRIYSFDLVLDNNEIAMCHWYNPVSSAPQFSIVWTLSDLNGNLLQAEEYTFQGYSDLRPENIYFWKGMYYIYGYTNAPSRDLFLLQITPSGQVNWARVYGGNGTDDLFTLSRSKPLLFHDNTIFLVGQSTSNSSGGTDIFFLRINEDGTMSSPCNYVQDVQVFRKSIMNPYQIDAPLQEISFGLTMTNVNPNSNSLQFSVDLVACSEPCAEDCSNGVDDDGDGLIDCLDPDCCGSIACPSDTLFDVSLCPGDTLFYLDSIFTDEGIHCYSLLNSVGCDSMVCIDLSFGGLTILEQQLVQPDCNDPDGGEILISVSGGTLPYSYQWSPTAPNTPSLSNLIGGTYSVTVTDVSGCSGVAVFQLDEISYPNFTVEVTPPLCFGEQGMIEVMPTSGMPPFMYSFDGGINFGPNASANLFAGSYILAIKDASGCITDTIVEIVQPPPLVLIVGQDTFTAGTGEVINLLSSGAGGTPPYSFSWSPTQGLSCSNCPDPTVVASQIVAYTVTLTDANGCTRSLSIAIDIQIDKGIYVPNAFSPNADGINDLFHAYGSGVGVLEVERLQVWDRWGELLWEGTHFQLNDPNIGWDGFWRGELMDPAVFVYVLDVKFVDGVTKTYTGDFTLVR